MKHNYCVEIDTIYRCSIYFDLPSSAADRLSDYVFDTLDAGVPDEDEFEIEKTSGGPAWGQYYTITSKNRDLVEKLAEKIHRQILRLQGAIHE